jgi:uncharacterized membrane protein
MEGQDWHGRPSRRSHRIDGEQTIPDKQGGSGTSSVTNSIDVNVPISTAYSQWTQFELFPQFMDGVKKVHQTDDKRLHWRAAVGRETQVERPHHPQIPDQGIAWTSVAGDITGGAGDFHRLRDDQTRITLTLDYDPRGFLESVGDALGFMDRRVDSDLKRFKQFIESRGARDRRMAWHDRRSP